jgi:prenylcysteine oxidase/farnesylcysteine lyase
MNANIKSKSYNDKTILTSTARPYASLPYSTWLSLLFHYGPSIWRAHALPTGTISSFTKLLHTRPRTPFPSTQALLRQLSGTPTSTSALARLQKNGISSAYTHDVLAPQVRRHTGQEVSEISDLALSIALWREEQGVQREAQGVYSAIMNSFLSFSRADLRTATKVTGLRREVIDEDGAEKWILEYMDLGNASAVGYEVFDKIVIAAPFDDSLVKDSIALGDADADAEAPQTKIEEYRAQYMTFFSTRSPLPHSRFGRGDTLPNQLLPQTPSSEGITEISFLRTITHPTLSHQYRLLSSLPLSNATFQMYIGLEPDALESWTQYSIPYAYPPMYARSSVEVKGEFEMRTGLWTTSGAEGVLGSSVDLSWVVGRNVGRLVGGEIKRDKIMGK